MTDHDPHLLFIRRYLPLIMEDPFMGTEHEQGQQGQQEDPIQMPGEGQSSEKPQPDRKNPDGSNESQAAKKSRLPG